MGIGIIAGIASALLQSVSYVCSAGFMLKYRSSLRLVVLSQLVMGAFCLPLALILFPREVLGVLPEFLTWVGLWVVCFTVGQTAFFNTLRTIEASRMSSLLGLKVIVLALLSVLVMRQLLSGGQWVAVVLSAIAAVGMNWSGGSRFSPRGLFWLAVTLFAYSMADVTETHLVRMLDSGSIVRDAFAVGTVCYALLGVLTLPFLVKFRVTRRQLVKVTPFAVTWFLSQVALFVCFGLIGPVFGNVIQASRGLISIALGVLLMHIGLGKLDAGKLSRRMWIRRAIAGTLMAAGIILYSWFRPGA